MISLAYQVVGIKQATSSSPSAKAVSTQSVRDLTFDSTKPRTNEIQLLQIVLINKKLLQKKIEFWWEGYKWRICVFPPSVLTIVREFKSFKKQKQVRSSLQEPLSVKLLAHFLTALEIYLIVFCFEYQASIDYKE